MKVTVIKSDVMADWWTIERAAHDGKTWMEPHAEYPNVMSLRYSGRISDADVEGDSHEMHGLAAAIIDRKDFHAKRCAAIKTASGYELSSPRNSTTPGAISFDEADALVADIIAKVFA